MNIALPVAVGTPPLAGTAGVWKNMAFDKAYPDCVTEVSQLVFGVCNVVIHSIAKAKEAYGYKPPVS